MSHNASHLERLEEINAAVVRFRTVAGLGRSALKLQRQVNTLERETKTLGSRPFTVPEGLALRVSSQRMDLATAMKIEILAGQDFNRSVWCKLNRSAWDYQQYVMTNRSDDPDAFLAHSVSMDGGSGQVWMYNRDHTARVLMQDHLDVETVSDPTG